jgi:peptidase E
MIDIVNLSVFLAYTAIVTVLLVFCFKLRIEYKKTYALLVQSVFDKEELLKKFEEFVNDQSVKAIEETDGFVKFISQSRDWAFEYIEDVQKAIDEYKLSVESKDVKLKREKYKKLLEFLPDVNN